MDGRPFDVTNRQTLNLICWINRLTPKIVYCLLLFCLFFKIDLRQRSKNSVYTLHKNLVARETSERLCTAAGIAYDPLENRSKGEAAEKTSF
jgi:hypothetical protein